MHLHDGFRGALWRAVVTPTSNSRPEQPGYGHQEETLRKFVHHAGCVDYEAPLEGVHELFTEREVDYFALVRDGMVTGLCSRRRLGSLLGARFGFSLYSRSPAHTVQVIHPLVFPISTPVREVLNAALTRPGEEFHEDIALVEDEGALIGLVPIDALARLQLELISHQMDELKHREKQALLDTLVGGIVHELNNKLTPIQGFSELIEMTTEGQSRNYAGLIAKSVREAAAIIRQLLQLSKPTHTVLQRVDLRCVVDEALTMLRFQIREANCTVRNAYSAGPLWVNADAGEIKQVVFNLVLNALQAMSDIAGPVLDVEVRQEESHVRIIVADRGVGIPPENLERIFEPFFTTKGPEKGTGLGLSVCSSIVRQHGGEITVESHPGQGTTFFVSLPRMTRDQPDAVAIGVAGPRFRLPMRAEAARVLVVEDEPQVRRFMRSVLAAEFDCEVDSAPNGMEGLERLATNAYDLVLSDVRMDSMGDLEFYLWLREAKPLLAERFVFVTGYPDEEHLAAEVTEWGITILTKPFGVEELCSACAPFLAAAGVERARS